MVVDIFVILLTARRKCVGICHPEPYEATSNLFFETTIRKGKKGGGGDGVVRTIFMILASRLVMRTILTNFEDCLTLFVCGIGASFV